MKSTISALGKVIDCRKLIISGSFFSLTQAQADDLFRAFYDFINDSFLRFSVLDWRFRDWALRDPDIALRTKKLKNGAYTSTCMGYVVGEIVYNKTTLRKYLRNIMYPLMPRELVGIDESVDFAEYYDSNVLSQVGNNERLKTALLELFDADGHMHQGEFIEPDIQAGFINIPMRATDGLYYGTFGLDISYFCLNNELEQWADEFCAFGKKLAERYSNINCGITLESLPQPYAAYYGRYPKNCDPIFLQTSLREYVRSFYLTDVFWANIICKKTCGLGIILPEDTESDEIEFEKLSGGGIFIRARNPISAVKTCDLKRIKRSIYSTIMPRENEMPLSQRLRRRWENVPVFENELFVTDKGVKFKHYGEIELEYICRALSVDPNKLR